MEPTVSSKAPKTPASAALSGVFFGAAPWIAAAVVASLGWIHLAILIRLGVTLAQNLFRLKERALKALELATLAYSLGEALLTFGLGWWWLLDYSGVTSQGVMALMALASVAAGSPFTYQYAREAWPREYWANPLFRRTNAILSLGFVGSFALGAGASAVALALPGAAVLWSALVGSVIPPLLGIGMGLFCAWFPKVYTRRVLRRVLLARAPHVWAVPSLPASPEHYDCDVVVVGSGIGGLTAAALLAKRGLRVTVLERHHLAGGCCSTWTRRTPAGRFLFDGGVHDISGLGPQGPVRYLLQELGIAGRLEWLPVTRQLEWEGLSLRIPQDADEFATLLGQHFPKERKGILRLFAEVRTVYRELYHDLDSTGGIPRHPQTVEEMMDYPRAHPTVQRWAGQSFRTLVRTFVQDPALERILFSLTAYLSEAGTELGVNEMACLFGYYFDGGFYPKGGSQALADALVAVIEEAGGAVRLRTEIRRILVDQGRVAGVEDAKGQRVRAPIVISNADLRRTFAELVGEGQVPAPWRSSLLEAPMGPSAAACFLGLDFVPELPAIVHCDWAGEGLGIAIPSILDPSLAPPDHSAVTLLLLIPAAEAATFDRKAPDYAARKRALGDELIRRAERIIPGIREHIVFREEATPATFKRYLATTDGGIYGVTRSSQITSAKTPIVGLFLAGSGAEPGSGIEGVVISGTQAANAILPAVSLPA